MRWGGAAPPAATLSAAFTVFACARRARDRPSRATTTGSSHAAGAAGAAGFTARRCRPDELEFTARRCRPDELEFEGGLSTSGDCIVVLVMVVYDS